MAGEPWDDWDMERERDLTREGLVERVERTTDGFASAVQGMPAEALRRPGAIGIWSGNDCVAHCVVWHEYAARVLASSLAGTFRAEDFQYGDEDEFNERTARELSHLSTEELLDRLREAARATVDSLMKLPEEEWLGRDRYYVVVQGEMVDHLDEHMGDLRAAVDAG